MAITVREIMNPELFSVTPATPVEQARSAILALGITAAPVTGPGGEVLGVVSLRDLVAHRFGTTAGERMTRPPLTVGAEAAIEEAGRLMAERRVHHLVVVDGEGRGVGFVSALDVVRGLVGLPGARPPTFTRLDDATGLVFSDDQPLEPGRVREAPDGPGLLVLVHGGRGLPETPVWVEEEANVRTRLLDLLSTPQRDQPVLAAWLASGSLRFRAAACDDPERRRRAREVIEAQIRGRRHH